MITKWAHFFLCEGLGAHEVRHSGRTLWDHLSGTYELLKKEGASEDVCLGGLFHSVYGTTVFKHVCLKPTPANRKLIAGVIGERAEHLAYLFGTIPRNKLGEVPDLRDRGDLLTIAAANLLEQRKQEGKEEAR